MTEELLLYTIENLDMNISEVLNGITDGLNDMRAGGYESGFQGGIVMLLRVPVEWAEIVEAAAARNGVVLNPIGEDEAEEFY